MSEEPTLMERWAQDATEERRMKFEQEGAILDATEAICRLMNERGVNRAELARRLNTTRGHVTQLLSGEHNLTLRKLSDIFYALGSGVTFQAIPRRMDQYLNPHQEKPDGT